MQIVAYLSLTSILGLFIDFSHFLDLPLFNGKTPLSPLFLVPYPLQQLRLHNPQMGDIMFIKVCFLVIMSSKNYGACDLNLEIRSQGNRTIPQSTEYNRYNRTKERKKVQYLYLFFYF